MDSLHQRLAAARQIVRDAGALALSFQERLKRDDLVIVSKGEHDFVSEADRATEQLIRDALSARFPQDGFLGEESGLTEGQGGMWIVDPIDGTSNYLRQHRHWCVSIAYVVAGEPVLGVIFDPVNDELFHACRGEGAYLNGARLQGRELRAGAGLVNIGYSARTPLSTYLNTIERLHLKGIEHRRLGSAALGLAYVAAGRFDGYVEARIEAWDVMAGVVIVREAGLRADLKPVDNGYAIRAGTPELVDWLS